MQRLNIKRKEQSIVLYWRFFATIAVLPMLCGCAITSRISRPEISGHVLDADTRKPLVGCKVGEVVTDSNGHFVLPLRSYLDLAFMGGEAPPSMVMETVEMSGYEKVVLHSFNKYGTSSAWKIEPILLVRLDGKEPVPIRKLTLKRVRE